MPELISQLQLVCSSQESRSCMECNPGISCSVRSGFSTRIRGAQGFSKPPHREAKSTLLIFTDLWKFACYPRMCVAFSAMLMFQFNPKILKYGQTVEEELDA